MNFLGEVDLFEGWYLLGFDNVKELIQFYL